MFYLKFGSTKKLIVFLHGWAADRNSFLWTRFYFENYTKIYLDFPGFGNSEEPDLNADVQTFASKLKLFLDGFEIDELLLVGHSFGGRVAIKFASLFQNDYQNLKLCLIDSAGILPRRGIGYYFKVFRYKRLKEKIKKRPELTFKLEKFGSSDYKKLSNVMKKVFVNVVNEDLSLDAKKISSSTVLIWGEKDKDTKLWMGKKLNKLIKNSKLYVLKNAGHFSFLDRQDEFLIILDRFIQN